MEIEILSEILKRRKSKKADELSKIFDQLDQNKDSDTQEVREVEFGDNDFKDVKRGGDNNNGSTDELLPTKKELKRKDAVVKRKEDDDEDEDDDDEKDEYEDEKERFRSTLKKEVRPFSSKSKSDSNKSGSADDEVFSDRDFREAEGKQKSGRSLNLFDRVQLNIGKKK